MGNKQSNKTLEIKKEVSSTGLPPAVLRELAQFRVAPRGESAKLNDFWRKPASLAELIESNPIVLQDLSPELLEKVKETFKIFDVDGSKSIDKEEAIKHWKTKFGKLSAKEFFN